MGETETQRQELISKLSMDKILALADHLQNKEALIYLKNYPLEKEIQEEIWENPPLHTPLQIKYPKEYPSSEFFYKKFELIKPTEPQPDDEPDENTPPETFIKRFYSKLNLEELRNHFKKKSTDALRGVKELLPLTGEKEVHLPIEAEEEGRAYAQILSEIPVYLPLNTLDEITGSLFASNYTLAYRELNDVATDKTNSLNKDKRVRVRKLIAQARSISENQTIKGLFEQTIEEEYRVRLIKPGGSDDDLRRTLANVGLCWIKRSNMDESANIKKARWLQKDTDVGACVQIIGETPDDAKSYTRNYIAETKNEEKTIFLDTIEGGNIGWNTAKEWSEANRGRELLYQLSATIYMARTLGIDLIALGEREMQDIAGDFGFQEKPLFDHSQKRRKIGIQNRDGNGPYSYRLSESASRHTINIPEITPPSLEELFEQVGATETFVRPRTKKLAKNAPKTEEVRLYLDSIAGINEHIYKNESLGVRISDIYELLPD